MVRTARTAGAYAAPADSQRYWRLAEDLGLLRGELLVREDALRVQLRELLELLHRVRSRRSRRRSRGRRGRLVVVLLAAAALVLVHRHLAPAGAAAGAPCRPPCHASTSEHR